jgi:HlyD family secretion protein
MATSETSKGFLVRSRWWIWIAIVAGVVLLASFMSRDDAVPVRAAVAQMATIRSMVSTNGKVEPINNFEAHAPVGTMVEKLLVKEGDHVKQGQLLVRMDDAEALSQAARALAQIRSSQADVSAVQLGGAHEEVLTLETQLSNARNARDIAQHNLDALQKLQQQGAASSGEVRDARAQLDRANADLSLLESKKKQRYSQPEVSRVESQQAQAQASYGAAEDVLRQLNIRAPFDGTVYSLPVREGAYVNPGDLILQEANLSQVRVRAFVDEPDIGRLADGDAIEVTWDAVPGRTWTGTVSSVPSVVKLHGTRNVGETTCVVDNRDFRLLPNINVGVSIITSEHQNALTVPREAVHQENGRSYVYQIVNGELRSRDIQTSVFNLTQVEVTSGIQQDAQVALASMNSKPLRSGLPVKVVQ